MNAPIVTTRQGKLKGKVATDYNGTSYCSFKGIPYAKPPINELRFKAPVPHDSWTGIKDATQESTESLSRHLIIQNKIIGSEDCLYLNVYTPQLPCKETSSLFKPVMFWIHGGGFILGSNHTEIYGPDYLLTRDVVVVSINYRLGILGFLSLEDTSLGVPGNAGLKDMVQALKWVQENIENFGGNPKNVTIFGESAGGAACHLLTLSPMAKGLFHRAILQSGCALNPWVIGNSNGREIAKNIKFNSTNEKELLEFLRTMSSDKILELQDEIKDHLGNDKIRPICPVIEKLSEEPAFITEDPIHIIASGNYYKVPIMIGYTSREGMIIDISNYQQFGSIQLVNDFETKIPHYYNIPRGSELSKDVANKIQDFYYGTTPPCTNNSDNFLKMETDILFWRGIYVAIKEHLKTLDLPIYLYKLTAETKLNFYKQINKWTAPGVSHCDDIGYLFKTEMLPDIERGSLEEDIMIKMVKLWTNFAKYGNPNPIDDVTWNPIEKDHFHYLDIGKYICSGANPDLGRMKFWDDISNNKSINSKL